MKDTKINARDSFKFGRKKKQKTKNTQINMTKTITTTKQFLIWEKG